MEAQNQKFNLNFGPFFIAFAAFLWTTDLVLRVNLENDVSATQVVFIDHLIIILVLSPFLYKFIPDLKKFSKYEWFSLLFIGIGGSALASIALTQGFFTGDFPFQYVGIVIFMQQTQPLFAFFLAHVLLKERLPNYFYPLAGLSIISVILIISPYLFDNGKFILFENLLKQDGFMAGMFGLIAAFLWGASTVFGRYILQHGQVKPTYFQMASYRFLIAGIFLTLFIPFYGPSNGYPSLSVLLKPELTFSFLYLALIVGLFSLVLYYYGLKTTHASISTLAELAYPLSYYLLVLPLVNPTAAPSLIQFIGGIALIVNSTFLSYNYGKISFKNQQPDLVNLSPS
jgi:drug/metabolite transporter (DMT)-like permease